MVGTNGEFFLDMFLLAHSVPRPTVQVVDMRPEAMVEALSSGTVDAVAT